MFSNNEGKSIEFFIPHPRYFGSIISKFSPSYFNLKTNVENSTREKLGEFSSEYAVNFEKIIAIGNKQIDVILFSAPLACNFIYGLNLHLHIRVLVVLNDLKEPKKTSVGNILANQFQV